MKRTSSISTQSTPSRRSSSMSISQYSSRQSHIGTQKAVHWANPLSQTKAIPPRLESGAEGDDNRELSSHLTRYLFLRARNKRLGLPAPEVPNVNTIAPISNGADAGASAESEEVITVAGDDSCPSDDPKHASRSPSPSSSDESEIDELFDDDDDDDDEETRTSSATTLGSDVGISSREEEEVPASDEEEGFDQGSQYDNCPSIRSSPRSTSYLRPSLPPNYNDEVVPESPTLIPQSPLFTPPPSSPLSSRHSWEQSTPRGQAFERSPSPSLCEEEGCQSPLFTPPSSPQKRAPAQLDVNQGNDHGAHQRACSRSLSPVVDNGDEDGMIVDEVDDESESRREAPLGSTDGVGIVSCDQRNNLYRDGVYLGAKHYAESISSEEYEWDNRDGSITATGSNGSGPCDDEYELCYPSEPSGGEYEEHEECAAVAIDLLKTEWDSDVSSAHGDHPNTSPSSLRTHASLPALPPDITQLPSSSPTPNLPGECDENSQPSSLEDGELVDTSFPPTFAHVTTVSRIHEGHSDLPIPNASLEEGELRERQPLSAINLPFALDTPSPSPPPKQKPGEKLSVQITPIPAFAPPSTSPLVSPSTSTNGIRFIQKITEPKRKRKQGRKSSLESAPPAKRQRVRGSLALESAPSVSMTLAAGPSSTTPVHSPTETRTLFKPPVAAPRPHIPSKPVPLLKPRVLHEKDITDVLVIGWANHLRDGVYLLNEFMAEQTHGKNLTVVLNEIEAWKHTLVPSLRERMRARRTQQGLLNRGKPMQVEKLVELLYEYKDKADWGMVIQQKVVRLLQYFWKSVPEMTARSW